MFSDFISNLANVCYFKFNVFLKRIPKSRIQTLCASLSTQSFYAKYLNMLLKNHCCFVYFSLNFVCSLNTFKKCFIRIRHVGIYTIRECCGRKPVAYSWPHFSSSIGRRPEERTGQITNVFGTCTLMAWLSIVCTSMFFVLVAQHSAMNAMEILFGKLNRHATTGNVDNRVCATLSYPHVSGN